MKVIKYWPHASFYGKCCKYKYSPSISWKLQFSQENKYYLYKHAHDYKIETLLYTKKESYRSYKSLRCEIYLFKKVSLNWDLMHK